jgi:hypothetical protein
MRPSQKYRVLLVGYPERTLAHSCADRVRTKPVTAEIAEASRTVPSKMVRSDWPMSADSCCRAAEIESCSAPRGRLTAFSPVLGE